ncbi:MAG: TRAP transporter small permease [Casimicrobium sp.]
MTSATEPKVLDDDGQFHATDAPIDLSVYGWEDWISLGFFLLLALDIFYQFFTRYVLSDSAAWTEEIARYLLIIVVFLGASMAVRKNTHIHVEFVFRYLPLWMARALSTFVDLVRVAFLGYATWLACELVPKMHNLSMTVVDFPMSYIYGFVAAGFALMTYRAVEVSIKHWRQGWSTLERPMEGL